ncbi:MAG: CPBP family intramembrane metalloprotease [Clostridiaceae bacterium]|nr:CPBP family intramembrane metalloprotease [Clostridiaceae bacterium]
MKKNHDPGKRSLQKIIMAKAKPRIRGTGIDQDKSEASIANYSHAGTLLLLHTVFYLLADLLIQNSPAIRRVLYSNSLSSFAASGLLTQGMLILLPTILIILIFRIDPAIIAGGRPRAGTIILALAAGIPAAAVFQGLNNLLVYFLIRTGWQLPASTTPYVFSTDIIWSAPWNIKLVILIISAFLPAFAEELMFRGVIQGSLASRSRMAIVIFWQAAAFTLFHLDPLFILPPLLAGLMLGYLRYKSQSLMPPIICHISLNISLMLLNPLLPRLTKSMLEISTETTQSLFYASLISSCIAAVALVPLLVIIGNYSSYTGQEKKRLRLFPGDWKLALALIIMLLTIGVSYFNSIS